MNVLIDVYLDNNLGDDIMGDIIIQYLHKKGFKCFLKAHNEFTYKNFVSKYKDIVVLDNINKKTIKKYNLDYFIRIGGSMFPHNNIREGLARYQTLLNYISMKKNGMKIIFIGCNVGPFHTNFGVLATKLIIKLSDLITCRDNETYDFISKIKSKNFFVFPDIVLSKNDCKSDSESKSGILGISTYTGYTKQLKKYNLDYSELMIKIIDNYIKGNKNSKVKLFVFNSGYTSDYPTTHKIYKEITKIYNHSSIEIIDFQGNIEEFLNEYNKCSVIIGARFHSIILALLYNIPVLPIIYSNKTKNLLNDINYCGPTIDITKSKDINYQSMVKEIRGEKLLSLDDKSSIFNSAKGHLNSLDMFFNKEKGNNRNVSKN